MPYITHMISRPIEPAFAGTEVLGIDYGAAATAGTAIVGGVMTYFGQKEASKQAAAQAKIAEAQAAAAAAMASQSRGGGIPMTYLLIGGAVIAGALVFAMRRK
jgi:hypothetical protein